MASRMDDDLAQKIAAAVRCGISRRTAVAIADRIYVCPKGIVIAEASSP